MMQHGNYQEVRKIQQYVSNMRPMFNKAALYSDRTQNYREPYEPDPGDTVTIRFRTLENNVDGVYIVRGEEKTLMDYAYTECGFDFYETKIQVEEDPVYYYFEITSGRIRCYFGEQGLAKEQPIYTQFSIVPGFHTPQWAKGAVMYQIYVDRFCNGDPSNDVETGEYFYIGAKSQKVLDWYDTPQPMDIHRFYGGDIQGIWDKLDYLQELGVDVLYLNPIFVSPSNHKYDCQDYDYIDPHYGKIVEDGGELLADWDRANAHAGKYIKRVTDKKNLEASNQFFAEFVEEVHRRGMRIILDGVFNHCGSFNKWLDRERIYEYAEGYEKGAYVDAFSPYRSFFHFYNENAWPYNDSYDGWWGHDTLPKLNYEQSGKLYEYIMEVARKWVSPPYNVDGWRLDVAADLGHSNEYNHRFWKDFRKNVKEANPDAIILAEHYGEAREWLRGDEWDTIMNYDAFMEPITWFLTGMEKHSDEYNGGLYGNSDAFKNAMTYHLSRMTEPTLEVAMNELSNHDHSRFLTRTNKKVGRVAQLGPRAAEEGVSKAVFREAIVMQMTWPGAPTIYYGDEVGLCGFTDPDNRRTYPWGREDMELLEFYKGMIQIHKGSESLLHGSLKYLHNDYQRLTYGRFTRHYKMVISVNNRQESAFLTIPVWQLGADRSGVDIYERMALTTSEGYTFDKTVYQSKNGLLEIELPPVSAVVLRKIPSNKS